MIKRVVLSALLGLAFFSPIFAAGVADQVAVEGAFVRAVPPGLTNSAAFLTLINQDAVEHKLVSVKSSAAEVVELHTHINDEGMMRMRRVDGIEVSANGSMELKPGGHHVMLIGLRKPLLPGDRIDLTLGFEDGSEIRLQAPVNRVTAPVMKCGSGKCGGDGKCGMK